MDIDAFISEIDDRIERIRKRGKILILGSNYPDDEDLRRDKMIKHLQMLGYKNTRKMEDLGTVSERFDERFCNLFQEYDMIIALLARGAAREGVCWEIGFMQGLSYNEPKRLYDKLFLCIQRGVLGEDGGKETVTKMVSEGIVKDNDIKTIPFEENESLLKELWAQTEAHFLAK